MTSIRSIRLGILLVFIGLFLSCVPPEKKTTEVEVNINQEPTQAFILDLAYRQNLDSLLSFIDNPNATNRFLAVSAFSSFITLKALDTLIGSLADPVPEVVGASAHALGQIGSTKAEQALIRAFVRVDSSGIWILPNSKILEAIGKVGSISSHNHLAGISTYLPIDTSLLLGQIMGLFNFSVRQMTNEKGLRKAIDLLDSDKYGKKIRLYAAHYISRSKAEDLVIFSDTLTSIIKEEKEVEVLISLLKGASITQSPELYRYLIAAYNTFSDTRVKVAIIQNIHYFKAQYPFYHQFIVDKTMADNYHEARTAVDFLYNYGKAKFARQYWIISRNPRINPEISKRLYACSFKFMPVWHTKRMASMRFELYQSFIASSDLYEKALIIEAFGENIDNIQFVSDSIVPKVKSGILHTALATAFSTFAKSDIIPVLPKRKRLMVRDSINNVLIKLLKTENIGTLTILGSTLRNRKYTDGPWADLLEKNLLRLDLPKDYEAYIELDKTVAYLRDSSFSFIIPDLNLREIVLDSSLQNQKALVKTNIGTFILELLADKAPYTVTNFMDLVEKGYYNNKTFHRVVSNFVVQTGCSIGDGYGSLDYVISSEVKEAYYDKIGYVGMASVGLHTESSQWFINLVPTPHLNGRFTIFARVSSGMTVVQKLKIGDKIISVSLIN